MQRPSPSPETGNPVLQYLRRTHPGVAWIPLETFVEAALYAPEIGYYTRPAISRVGSSADRDFYTASSLGSVFARLVTSAVRTLWPSSLGESFTFVELGAEPDRHLFSECPCPFARHRIFHIGEPIDLEGPCVVFSNELFDAQPFRQFQVCDGQWFETGVRLDTSVPSLEPRRPTDLPEDLGPPSGNGYILDYPSGARRLIEALLRQPWNGLFLAFDYGLTLAELCRLRPVGTARTYHAHRLGNDLLATPGTCDITHHVCWDHLSEALRENGFDAPTLESQESFLMRHASAAIEQIVARGARTFDPEVQTLKTLLHPENMGRKFQVLHAVRPESERPQ